MYNNSTSISVPSGMTVTAWVYANASDFPSVITLYNGSYSYCFGVAYSVGVGADLTVFDNIINAECRVDIMSGTWYHIAFTVDFSKNVTMYVNGSIIPDNDSASSNVVNTYISTITKVEIGTRGGADNWFGNIDDVRIYNKVLSASEISALYSSY